MPGRSVTTTWTEPKANDFRIPPDGFQPYKSPGHEEDWIRCIRSRRQPLCHAEVGHRTATICHLGNIATRTGVALLFEPTQERVTNHADAAALVRRQYREGHWAVPKGV